MSSDADTLVVQDISVCHQAGVRVLHHVSLQVAAAERVGLIGESGSGKSTLALTLLGLLPPELIASGSIKLGASVAYPALVRTLVPWRGRRLALVAQDPHAALHPLRKLGHQLDEVLRLVFCVPRAEARLRTLAMLERVGLAQPLQIYEAYPHTLSGGMLQRVCLCMALLAAPDVLIADEPTTALDVTLQAQIMALLADLTQRHNMGLLLISHDLAVCAALTQRIVVLFGGEVVEEAHTAQLISQPRHPYTAQLLEAARATAMRARTRLVPARGTNEEQLQQPVADPGDAAVAAATPGHGCAFASRCARVQPLCRHVHPPLIHTPARGSQPARWVRCLYPIERSVRRTQARTPSEQES